MDIEEIQKLIGRLVIESHLRDNQLKKLLEENNQLREQLAILKGKTDGLEQ